MKNLLVVVDMVNGFVNFGALSDKNINKITPNIISLIEKAKKNNVDIVAFRDCHKVNDKEFKTYPPHCLKGDKESELIDELKPFEKDMILINKNTTNGFKTKKFQKIMQENKIQNVYVCGCCTDICVKDFVSSLIKYSTINNLPINVHVYDDACYTFDGPNHNAQKFHSDAISFMENMGAEIKMVNKVEKDREI